MSAQTVVTITHDTESVAQMSTLLKGDSSRSRIVVQEISKYLAALTGGFKNGHVQVITQTDDGVAATGTATLTFGSMANNDTLTIEGVVFTGVTGTPSGNQFKIVTDGPTTGANIVAIVNAAKLDVAASIVGSVVTLTSRIKGRIGNMITLTKSSAGIAVSGAVLSGGTEPTTKDVSPTDHSHGK